MILGQVVKRPTYGLRTQKAAAAGSPGPVLGNFLLSEELHLPKEGGYSFFYFLISVPQSESITFMSPSLHFFIHLFTI